MCKTCKNKKYTQRMKHARYILCIMQKYSVYSEIESQTIFGISESQR